MDDFSEKLLREYEANFARYRTDPDEIRIAESWLQTDTVDAWLHSRMFAVLDPIFDAFPDSNWLTVGDGRYCTDARYIQEHGHDVLATDVCKGLLEEALIRGVVKKNQVENAENLSFDDETFDFVLCKESYHHFARPMRALYELLRVARKGVVLIEPCEKHKTSLRSPRVAVKAALGSVLARIGIKNALLASSLQRLGELEDYWESLGNYVYSISEREITKVAYGLNLPVVAFRGINVAYQKGVEFEKADESSAQFREIAARLKLAENSMAEPTMLSAIIFKQALPNDAAKQLEEKKYRVLALKRSPIT